MQKKLIIGISCLFLLFMFFVFYKGLFQNSQELDLVIQDEPLPDFSLPEMDTNKITGKTITKADFVTDTGYYLINVWGSWCPGCYDEIPFLDKLSPVMPIYGVNWRDEDEDAFKFLQTMGNPYRIVVSDPNSRFVVNLGVYGAPETFLISKEHTILFRYAGPLTEAVWETQFLPRMQ